MRTTYSRGARRLIVTAGAMSLGLAAMAPGAVLAAGGGPANARGPEAGGPAVGGAPSAEETPERKVWVCHANEGRGEWEIVHVDGNAADTHDGHLQDVVLDDAEVDAVAVAVGVDPGDSNLNSNKVFEDQLVEKCGAFPGGDGGSGGSGGEGSESGGSGGSGGGSGSEGDGSGGSGGSGSESGGSEGAGGESGGTGGGSGESGGQNGNPDAANPGVGNENGNGNAGGTPPGQGGGDLGGGNGGDEVAGNGGGQTPPAPVVPTPPATPADPVVDRAPKPIVISTDTVTKPVVPAHPATPAPAATPAQPATPAPATPARPSISDDAEVLGAVTTRTPGGQVVGTLPRTGTGATTTLATAGVALLLAGAALEAASRRTHARAGGRSA